MFSHSLIPRRKNLFCSFFVAVLVSLVGADVLMAQSHPSRGLWVGQARLSYVGEVTVPLDESNTPIAPDPLIPTPTSDIAELRLILHVNGAGQVNLLKDVAILNRSEPTAESVNLLSGGESDLVLVTDERLYSDFPIQVATRIASAVFDFGDDRATRAVNAVLDAAVDKVATYVMTPSLDLSTSSARVSAENAAVGIALDVNGTGNVSLVITNADVADAFDDFLQSSFPVGEVDYLAAGNSAATALAAATNSMELSFFRDDRAKKMVDAVVAAVGAAPPGSETNHARNAAAAFADVDNQYQRFISGELFEETIQAAASVGLSVAAAGLPDITPSISDCASTNSGAATLIVSAGHGLGDGDRIVIAGSRASELNAQHEILRVDDDAFVVSVALSTNTAPKGVWLRVDPIHDALNSNSAINDLREEALRIQISRYNDTRAVTAIDSVINAVAVASAKEVLLGGGFPSPAAESSIAAAARAALKDEVQRFALPASAPTADYTTFVRSALFHASGEVAARGAAQAAITEKSGNLLADAASIERAARLGGISALQNTYAEAARAIRTELPMDGEFAAGEGDARLRWEIAQNEESPLDEMDFGLTAEVYLPANHPTNPFRHRRHPDHTSGFDIIREIRLDFDGDAVNPLERSGYGVDKITGVYREEITGLHKPLGPQKNVGLRVEGRFELNRISLIDTLNAR